MPPAAPFCNGTKWGKNPQGVRRPLDPNGAFNIIADALCPAASSAEGPAAYSVTPPAASVVGNVVFSAAATIIVGAGHRPARKAASVSDGHILFVCAKRIWKEKRSKGGARRAAPPCDPPRASAQPTGICQVTFFRHTAQRNNDTAVCCSKEPPHRCGST